jgi:hypothetical protein
MTQHSHILHIQTLQEAERVFSNILSEWSSSVNDDERVSERVSEEGIIAVAGLDLEWRPIRKSRNTHSSTSDKMNITHHSATSHDSVAEENQRKDAIDHDSVSDGDGDGDNSYNLDPHRVAIMQISLRSGRKGDLYSQKCSIYLIHLHKIFPHEGCPGIHPSYRDCSLFQFLTNPRVLKCGVGILHDKRKLEMDYGVQMRGIVELGSMMQRILTMAPLRERNNEKWGDIGSESLSWSLKDLARIICGVSLPKVKGVQCSDWAANNLTTEQVLYAAADAYYGLLSFEGMVLHTQEGDGSVSVSSIVAGLVDSAIIKTGRDISASSRLASSVKQLNFGSASSSRISPKSKRDGLTPSSSPIYDSCALLTKDGEFLSYCDKKRLNWYLSKGLADELSELEIQDLVTTGTISAPKSGQSRVVKLNFEAKGSGNLNDSYKRQQLQNVCVVCGLEQQSSMPQVNAISLDEHPNNDKICSKDAGDDVSFQFLLHHHVVPKAYRKVFPRIMVSKNNHDILPVCRGCKAEVANIYSLKMQALEDEYLETTDKEELQHRQHTSKIDLVRLSKVQGFCKTLLTSEFYKKVKITKEDGTKIIESIQVEEGNVYQIKESVLATLKSYVGSLADTFQDNFGSFDVVEELKKLKVDDINGIQNFVDQFEIMTLTALKEKKLVNEHHECDFTNEPTGTLSNNSVRNKETIIVQKLIRPYSLSDDTQLYLSKLQDFETMWRKFFLDTVRPRFMPPHWRVDYKHTLLIKK